MPTERYSLPFLTEACVIQSQIGWKAFIHGFTAVQWAKAQELYLQYKSRKTSGRRWISALIRKLWETIWAIWRYRNGLVHEQTNAPLKTINAILNLTMLKELQYGLSGLPQKYSYLFKKQFNEVLKTSVNHKKQWVLTVWVARDLYTPEHSSINNRHPTIVSVLLAWKHRIRQYEAYQNNGN